MLPDGAEVLIEGVLTTPLGALDSGRGGFVQDSTAGISLYLDASLATPLAAGTLVRAQGTVGDRYGQRTLRVAAPEVKAITPTPLPGPIQHGTGGLGEPIEGWRIRVAGRIVDAPSALADGTAVTVDDGSGELRVVVTPDAIGTFELARDRWISATGPLGQRDSSGTGTAGYRLIVALPGDLAAAVDPSPTPDPSPSPSASPEPLLITIEEARGLPVGSVAHVRGVTTSLPGQIGHPAMITIQDHTGAIVLRLAEADLPADRGLEIGATGKLATYFGQLELRVPEGSLEVLGTGLEPAPAVVSAGEIGETLETRLVEMTGRVVAGPSRTSGGDLDATIEDETGARSRIMADASTEVDGTAFERGTLITIRGIVGQRASRKDALDGYRVWLRDLDDVLAVEQDDTDGAADPADDNLEATAPTSIAAVLLAGTGRFTLAGVVTAGSGLLDTAGRQVVVQDATAAVELYLPVDHPDLGPGDSVRATGSIGTAYGAPRFKTTEIAVETRGAVPAPLALDRAPRSSEVWRLVRLSGTLTSLSRSGDRWRGELAVGSVAVPISGLPGAGIDASRLSEGLRLTVTGIVRRPTTGSSDQRLAIVPRGDADLVASQRSSATSVSDGRPLGDAGVDANGDRPGDPDGVPAADDASLASWTGTQDLRDLVGLIGHPVRVGGIVTERDGTYLWINDGTARAPVRLDGAARPLMASIDVGDAIAADGEVVDEGLLVVLVTDPAGVYRSARPGAVGLGRGQAGVSSRPIAAAPWPARLDAQPGPDALALPGGPTSAGLGSAGLLAGVGLGVRTLRRARARRGLDARIRRRLERLAGDDAAAAAGSSQ